MSNQLLKAAVTPPPTKHELRVAAARLISKERMERNQKRKEAIDRAAEKLEKAVIKAGTKTILRHGKVYASHGYNKMRFSSNWSVTIQVDVKIEGDLLTLRDELERLESIPVEETDEREIVRQLREREAGISTTPKDQRIDAIIATPALRKAVKEFGEKLLATPTQADKAQAIEVGGGL